MEVVATEVVSFSCRGPAVVREIGYGADGAISIGPGSFSGVERRVWEYGLGGYQVCQKWLKDRKGRTLTTEDIEHYKRIIGAIDETIRIQKEIDEVIEAHGGWPLPGSVPSEAPE